jgi:hypothetical protein
MPARMAIHIARWSSDHAMPSPRGDTGDEGMSWRSHTRPESRAGEMARGRPPSLALQHREVDCGHGESPPKHAAGSGPPIRNCELRTRGERPPAFRESIRRAGSRTIDNFELGSVGPPWLSVRHRELDIGHSARGAPTQSQRHPERSPEIFEGRSEGSAIVNQILRTWETVLRMTESLGNGPPWLAEPLVGRGRRGPLVMNCQFSVFNWQLCRCAPPIRYERARESIARLVVRTRNTRNLPKAKVNANETLGRCNATRSYASDAVHEFPRIRSAGLFPMMSFRRSGIPQLLLMQPSLVRRREVCDRRTSKAFS